MFVLVSVVCECDETALKPRAEVRPYTTKEAQHAIKNMVGRIDDVGYNLDRMVDGLGNQPLPYDPKVALVVTAVATTLVAIPIGWWIYKQGSTPGPWMDDEDNNKL
eukprot:g6376.t1